MEKFKDYFKIDNVIRILSVFNVPIGGYYFNTDSYLEYNADKKAYKSFMNKYYYNHLKKYNYQSDIINRKVCVRLLYTSEVYCIGIDQIDFMRHVFDSFNFISEKDKMDFFNSISIYDPDKLSRKLLYYINHEFDLCEMHLKTKPYNNPVEFMVYSILFNKYTKFNSNFNKKIRSPKEIEDALNKHLKKLSELKRVSMETTKIFNEEIDVNEFYNCFDYDKLCLILGKSILDMELNLYNNVGHMNKCAHILSHYIRCVEKYREVNSNYKPSIIVNDKREIFTFDDLKRSYELLINADKTYSEDYFEDILADEEFPWKIISSGNKVEIEEQNISQTDDNNNSDEEKKKSVDNYESKKLRVIEGFNYLKSMNPERVFKGIGKFEGYIGFEYSNGIVIFEKLYEEDKKVAINNATYIMNKYNFKRLSKFSKTQIMFILKKSKTGIKRLYHTEDMCSWKANIISLINNQDYTPEDYDYIDELIALREKEIAVSKQNKK